MTMVCDQALWDDKSSFHSSLLSNIFNMLCLFIRTNDSKMLLYFYT